MTFSSLSARNENLRPLLNKNVPLIKGKYGLRNHFWPLESRFLVRKSAKNWIFSKSPNVPILNFFWWLLTHFQYQTAWRKWWRLFLFLTHALVPCNPWLWLLFSRRQSKKFVINEQWCKYICPYFNLGCLLSLLCHWILLQIATAHRWHLLIFIAHQLWSPDSEIGSVSKAYMEKLSFCAYIDESYGKITMKMQRAEWFPGLLHG